MSTIAPDDPAPAATPGEPAAATSNWLVSGGAQTAATDWLVDDKPSAPDSEPASDWLSTVDAPAERREEPAPTNGHHAPAAGVPSHPAAEAYCRELLGAAQAPEAARAAGALAAGGNGDLLERTRTAAAEQMAASGRLGPDPACAHTPGLLAARENGTLRRGDSKRLNSHLEECLPCQATELRVKRAERVYHAIGAGAIHDLADTAVGATAAGVTAAGATAAGVTAAGVTTAGATAAWVADAEAFEGGTATPPLAPARDAPPPRRRRASPVFIGASAVCVAALIALVAVLLANKSNHNPNTSLIRASTPSVTAPPPAVHHAAARHHKVKVVVHHHATHHVARHKAAPTHAAPPPAAPAVVTPAPVAATPPPVTPAPAAPAPSHPTTSAPPARTVTQGSGGNLPPATAPTSTIGSH